MINQVRYGDRAQQKMIVIPSDPSKGLQLNIFIYEELIFNVFLFRVTKMAIYHLLYRNH